MPAFEHTHFIDPRVINNDVLHDVCKYCFTDLKTQEIESKWTVTPQQINAVHLQTSNDYKEIHGLEDSYLDLWMDSESSETYVDYCPCCGWWRIIQHLYIVSTGKWQIWNMAFGCAAALKELNLKDINIPLHEVRSYLTAKYDSRFHINPKVFEDVVGSVFKDIGYETHVVGRSGDGGIDVILEDMNNHVIGVQVKRSKNRIKVEQIRAFLGALVANNIPRGIFVTTSEFQPGCRKTIDGLSASTSKIELVNALQFYNALRLAQLNDDDIRFIPDKVADLDIRELYFYDWDVPMNSL
jgi:restriction system protein